MRPVKAPHPNERIRKRVGALLSDDRLEADRLLGDLRELRKAEGIQVFASALHTLAHLRLPETQAERLLEDLLEHRDEITRALGRDPGLRVAAIDYLCNVKKLLANPTIVERSQLESTERSAITDALTGLYNRRHFTTTLGLEMRRSERYGLRLTLLMLDLDAFKLLNDRYGHPFGDVVLQRVGRVLRRAVREADVACRYGGEEFSVVLPETDRLGAYAVAERVRSRIERSFQENPVDDHCVEVRVSGGIAAYPEDGNDAAELIARADEALYLSKSRGKNRISLYHSERRQEIRYPVRSTARVKLARPGDPEAIRVIAINLSRDGALLASPDGCRVGDQVSVRFEGRDGAGRPLSWLFAAHVVRVVEALPTGAGRRIAIAFDQPLPEECLFQQVRRTRILTPVHGARA